MTNWRRQTPQCKLRKIYKVCPKAKLKKKKKVYIDSNTWGERSSNRAEWKKLIATVAIKLENAELNRAGKYM